MNYQTAFCWEKGQGKRRNGDSILLQQVRTRRGRMLLAAVSDGIGGLEEGENASGFLVAELKRWFYGEAMELVGRGWPERRGLHRMGKSMARRLYHAAEGMKAYGEKEGCRLGATLTVVLLWRRRYLVCSVGDSRACLSGRRGCRTLTRDDVDGQGRLSRCIGSFGWYPPRFFQGRLGRGKMFLLCTDGFWRKLEHKDMDAATKAVGEVRLEEWMEQMGRELRRRGERDDISAIAIRVR